MNDNRITRRELIRGTLPASLALLGLGQATTSAALARAASDKAQPPVRAITRGPKYHWFGYYDKWQFDPENRYVLGMEVEFEHRSPRADDVIKIGMVDLQDDDKWIELGQSTAWCWQQGCMLQWIPGSKSKILWNDRQDESYVCRVLDVKTKKLRTVPHPIYTLSSDGKTAVSADFRRINDLRPGYGYAGFSDPARDELTPKDSGIYRVDLETGRQELIISIADVAKIEPRRANAKGAKHYFNHLLFNPDVSRFIFLHRWRPPGKGFSTRMFTAAADGSDLCLLDPSGHTSHFIWRDPDHILAWTKPEGKSAGYWLFKDRTNELQQIGKGGMPTNGHCTYLPGNEWILNDTYPDGNRNQHPYLYHLKTATRTTLGSFHSPNSYTGEWRCDTHPRFSRDGRLVCIDSPHPDGGRQLHLIDVSKIVGKG